MRRRALLAASVPMWEDEYLPPESTTFEFPLYLNTRIIEKTPDYLYRRRDADEISNQLFEFWRANKVGGEEDVSWPTRFFRDYPVFIDGYQVEDIWHYWGSFENIKTAKDYGDYNEIVICLDEFELYVDGYN